MSGGRVATASLRIRDTAEPAAAAIPAARSAGNGAILTLEGISLSFGGVAALTDVDLTVEPGQIHAVIGPNGAGKSSLINVISGIYRPHRGQIQLDGQSFGHVPARRLAHLGAARTFQNIALFNGLTVFDNIVMGLTARVRSTFVSQVLGLPRARREERFAHAAARQIIAFLELGAISGRLAGTLPYGLQKRVELARALVAAPRLLLLDEPMAGMTAIEKAEMSHFIRNARDTLGTAIVLIEHDIGVVMGLSDRITVLDHGRKIAAGTPREIRADQRVIDAYLGVAHDEATHDEATHDEATHDGEKTGRAP